MMGLGWRLVNLASHMLEPRDRESACGDIAESGEPAGRALLEILGLVVRRQAALWRDWRPWLAAIGVAGVVATFLIPIGLGLDADIDLQVRTYWNLGVHYGSGASPGFDIFHMICVAAALVLWTWASGFVLGALSGRTIWVTGAVFYFIGHIWRSLRWFLFGAPVIPKGYFTWSVLHIFLPLDIPAVFFLVLLVWGARRGLRKHTLSLAPALMLAAAIVILAVLIIWQDGSYATAFRVWSGGAWPESKQSILPYMLVSWPAAYIVATARSRSLFVGRLP